MDETINAYFDWMYDTVCRSRFASGISYRRIFAQLHDTEFRPRLKYDRNRRADGVSLRRRYAFDTGDEQIYDCCDECRCSVLEMMIALAIRCEETWMDDPAYGDRTSQWFWVMMTNLGLGSMNDARYDRKEATRIIRRFLARDYEPDGRGGLFYIKNCKDDLRKVEIWTQLCDFLNTIT